MGGRGTQVAKPSTLKGDNIKTSAHTDRESEQPENRQTNEEEKTGEHREKQSTNNIKSFSLPM